jgi:hypothetical protein
MKYKILCVSVANKSCDSHFPEEAKAFTFMLLLSCLAATSVLHVCMCRDDRSITRITVVSVHLYLTGAASSINRGDVRR